MQHGRVDLPSGWGSRSLCPRTGGGDTSPSSASAPSMFWEEPRSGLHLLPPTHSLAPPAERRKTPNTRCLSEKQVAQSLCGPLWVLNFFSFVLGPGFALERLFRWTSWTWVNFKIASQIRQIWLCRPPWRSGQWAGQGWVSPGQISSK